MRPVNRQSESPQSETAGECAYKRIRHDIVFAKLQPGTRLKLDHLKQPYAASVSTLREILFRLCAEGLVAAEGQRGFEVAPVSNRNFREVAAMRELLEAHAMAESFQRGDVEWEAELLSAHHKLSRLEARMLAGDKAEAETWKRYDGEFHRALIGACGSVALMDAHRRIYDLYLRYQIVAVIFRGEAAAQEHRDLLTAALARDHEAAVAILHRHIAACVEHTVRHGLLPD